MTVRALVSRGLLRVLGVWVCLGSVGAGATSYVDRPLEERIARAGRIVLARVASVEVQKSEPNRLTTVVRLEVEETFRGAPVKELVVRQLGGSHGGWSMELPGAAKFEAGERAVFLLRCPDDKAVPPSCFLAGLRDAKLPVVVGSARAEVMIPFVAHSGTERLALDQVRALAKTQKTGEAAR